jgi:cytoskeletal protein CcmA (bactofilin family)
MSFLGNSRPDLLKNSGSEAEATPRGSEARFIGQAPPAPEPVPSFGSERYTSAPATNTNDAPLAPDRCTNVLAAGARWKGSLKVEDSARIDGIFSGDIEAKGTVHVSEGAEVDAKIHATYIVISGNFKGEIRAERKAELMPTSRMVGDISAKMLSVHEGAVFDGGIQMTSDGARASTPARGARNGATQDEHAEERRARVDATANGA